MVLMNEKTSLARGTRRQGWFNVVRGAVRQVCVRSLNFNKREAAWTYKYMRCQDTLMAHAASQRGPLKRRASVRPKMHPSGGCCSLSADVCLGINLHLKWNLITFHHVLLTWPPPATKFIDF